MALFCLDCRGRVLGSFYLSAPGGCLLQCADGKCSSNGNGLRNRALDGRLYYLIPISAYMLGAFVSELLPNPIKHRLLVRWDTLLILIEMAVVLGIGFLPESAPVQISQVAINFIASMQYNTFRQAEGIPVATTFATNHIRQIGIGLAKEIRHRHTDEKSHRIKLKMHLKMLFFFAVGCIAGAFLSNHFLGKAIWATLLPLAFVFCVLLYADLVAEKSRIEEKPAGH